MTGRETAIEVAGVRLPIGTSLYHRGEERVLWFDDVEDDMIVVEATDGWFTVDVERFEECIADGILTVECRPPEPIART